MRTIKDLVCISLGLYEDCGYLDGICDDFDVDIDTGEIEELIDHRSQGLLCNDIAYNLYYKVIDRAVEELGLKYDKFDFFLNGRDTHLFYDDREVYKWSELETISETLDKNDMNTPVEILFHLDNGKDVIEIFDYADYGSIAEFYDAMMARRFQISGCQYWEFVDKSFNLAQGKMAIYRTFK